MTKNNKLMSIELVTNVKDNGEVETKTFYRPSFTPLSKMEIIDKKIQGIEKVKSDFEAMKQTAEVIVYLYNNQFTVEELLDGIDIAKSGKVFEENIGYIMQGIEAENETDEQKANLEKVTK